MKLKLKYRKIPLRLFIMAFPALLSLSASAQYEPMFTQYMFNELFINPAYAGSHENLAVALLYRNQWVGIDGSPKTQTMSIHAPLNQQKIGVGLSVMNETIGVTHQIAAYGDFSYRIMFRHSTFSFGLQGGIVNDLEKFTDINTIVPGDNQFLNDTRKYFLPNAGFGMYYYRQKFYAGISIPRLLENKIDPSSASTVVRNIGNPDVWHYYFATGGVLDLNEDVKFKPSLMIKAVKNAPVELDLNANFILRDFLWIGGAYRSGDAVAGMVGFQLTRQMRLGYSYDYTLSSLQRFNSGSHEITLSYDFVYDKRRVITPRYF